MSCQELSTHEAAFDFSMEDSQPYCLTSNFYRLRVQTETARR